MSIAPASGSSCRFTLRHGAATDRSSWRILRRVCATCCKSPSLPQSSKSSIRRKMRLPALMRLLALRCHPNGAPDIFQVSSGPVTQAHIDVQNLPWEIASYDEDSSEGAGGVNSNHVIQKPKRDDDNAIVKRACAGDIEAFGI